ncbi:type II toxin-antitoxin system PemK/MazF family toxin [Frankia sp. CcWB2]
MISPRRGEVWLVDFGEPIGHEQGLCRPAVVVSADRLNRSRSDCPSSYPSPEPAAGCPPTSSSRPAAPVCARQATQRSRT